MIDERHFRKLESVYAAAPSSIYDRPALHVSLGQAQLDLDLDEVDVDAVGAIDRALYYKLLCDASALAANSLVEDRLVAAESFNMHVIRPSAWGAVTALSRVVSEHGAVYSVEAVLLDRDGQELALGNGLFSRSDIELYGEGEPPFDRDDPDEAGAPDGSLTGHAYGTLFQTPFGWIHLN